MQQEQRPVATGNQTANAPSAAPVAAAARDEPVNLFEAAAQAGQGGRGAGAGARGLGGAAGLGALGAGLGAGAGGDEENMGNLEFLRDNPQFQQLRQVVQQQPAMLEAILQQVAAGNPQLANLIGANQAQFMQLLSENGDDDAPLPPGAQTVEVTEEEQAAIERVGYKNSLFQDCRLTYISWFFWVSTEIKPFKPTSPATRTRSWLPISYSINLMMI